MSTNDMDVFTAISVCSGYEGIGLGLKRAIPNIRTICYVERESFAIANMVAKIKKGFLDDAPIWSDVATFDSKPWIGKVDLLHGGYPCQGFSHAGKRLGKDDPRHLWPHISRIVSTVRPLYCFFENVAGHVTLGLNTVVSDLGEMGYRATWGLFSAREVGAPHQRKRVFILAKRSDSGCDRGTGTGRIHRDKIHKHKSEQRTGAGPEIEGCSGNTRKELGNTEHDGLHGPEKPGGVAKAVRDNTKGTYPTGELEGAGNTGELADSNEQGLQGVCIEGCTVSEGRQEPDGSVMRCGSAWPARPREEQYEWEPPRTILPNYTEGDCAVLEKYLQIDPASIPERDVKDLAQNPFATPLIAEVGRDVNGYPDWMVRSTNRIDELRLLGNGVVPATVEKAWRTLYARIDRMKENKL